MRRLSGLCIGMVAAVLLLTACDNSPKKAETTQRAMVMEGKTMGTFWRVSLAGVAPERESALREKIQAQLDADDWLLSTWKKIPRS